MMQHALTISAGRAPSGADDKPGDEFGNVAQEKSGVLASFSPGRAPGNGCGSAPVTNQTSSPAAKAGARVVFSVDTEDVDWQAASINNDRVALEDHGGDNGATVTRDGAGGMANCSGFGFTNQGTDLIVVGKGGSAALHSRAWCDQDSKALSAIWGPGLGPLTVHTHALQVILLHRCESAMHL